MVLEAHVSSENATEPSHVHLVELYSQYGSQVCVHVCVHVCVCVCRCVCEREVLCYQLSFFLQTPVFINRELVDQGVAVWKEDSF